MGFLSQQKTKNEKNCPKPHNVESFQLPPPVEVRSFFRAFDDGVQFSSSTVGRRRRCGRALCLVILCHFGAVLSGFERSFLLQCSNCFLRWARTLAIYCTRLSHTFRLLSSYSSSFFH